MGKNIVKNFIVFEGLDGAGTSTQSKLLSEKIPDSFLTFEPTDGVIGSLIRDCLKKKIKLTQHALSYLFAADRSEHLYKKDGIIERCRSGQMVISDRYLFSSLAYQSLDVPFELVFELNNRFPLPEIVFFLNTSINECQKRVNARGNSEELFEDKTLQERILANYKKAFLHFEETDMKLIELNGDLSTDELLKKELESLKNFKLI